MMMYLIHHYLIDVVGGAFLASCLYFFVLQWERQCYGRQLTELCSRIKEEFVSDWIASDEEETSVTY
jgi:hypothetical protein